MPGPNQAPLKTPTLSLCSERILTHVNDDPMFSWLAGTLQLGERTQTSPTLRGSESRCVVTASVSDHALTAPAVNPATIHLCAIRNIRIAGRMVSVMNASTNCQEVEYWP